MSPEKIIEAGKKTLRIESRAISEIADQLGQEFVSATRAILDSKGRVVVTGIGKSANIANKIVATFNSTGTPALFMHAADAIHGDLGLIQKDDIVICLSKSGNTPEIQVLIPLIKLAGNQIIGFTSNRDSFLGKYSDHLIHLPISQEACPNNLAPTTSTTAQLAMGDAMAVALIEARGFTSEDFAKYHPGGALGKRLYLRVDDVLKDNNRPEVRHDATIEEVIIEMTGKRLGATAVTQNNSLVGIITDGDLRRMLQNHDNTKGVTAQDIMSPSPKSIEIGTLAIDAFGMMESNNITQLVIVDDDEYKGIIHLHDLLSEGIY